MLPTLLPATEEHDEAILALFDLHEIPPPLPFWARAFGEKAPKGSLAFPYVAMEGPRLTGYAVVRPARYYIAGDLYDAQILLDALPVEGPSGEQAMRLFLEQLPNRRELTFVIGPGQGLLQALRASQWRFIAPMTRFELSPAARPPAGAFVPAPIDRLPRGFGRSIEQRMAGEGLSFLARSERLERAFSEPGENCPSELYALSEGSTPAGFLRVVERRGLVVGRRELHLLDARVPRALHLQAAQALVGLATSRQIPLYASFLCPGLAAALMGLGARALAPRHAVFCRVGGSDHRELLTALHAETPFSIHLADGELDARLR